MYYASSNTFSFTITGCGFNCPTGCNGRCQSTASYVDVTPWISLGCYYEEIQESDAERKARKAASRRRRYAQRGVRSDTRSAPSCATIPAAPPVLRRSFARVRAVTMAAR